MYRTVRGFRRMFVEARFTSLLASLFILALRTGMFFSVGISETPIFRGSFVWSFVATWFDSPWISFAASTICVFLIATLIANLNTRFSLIRTRTNLPFIVPLFLFSLHPYFLQMSPDYISVIFILSALTPLLQSYQKVETQLFSFRSSILISLAAVFQVYALVLLPLWWRGEFSMRGIHFKSLLASLFGVILVFFSVGTFYLFFDNLEGFTVPFLQFTQISIRQLPTFSTPQWTFVAFIFLFFFLYMFFSINTYKRDKVITLTVMQFMVFMLIISLTLQAVYWRETLFFLSLSMAFIAYLIAYFYTMTVNKYHIYGAYFMLLLLIGFYFSNYFPFLTPVLQ